VRMRRRRSRRAMGCSSFASSISCLSPSPSPSQSSSSSYPAPLPSRGPARQAREEDIVIVGGGISGLATALALHRYDLHSETSWIPNEILTHIWDFL
jgi:hypothetical protein